ncbi:MAG: cytochrome c oxidase accessory protein CcoG [Betaproteobacteria bacterium]|nr:cytochrome c oxidase accessory protein CcoG [Betaproteobacteria bacterium]NBZ98110.1 cytochrome c oxidase accessory protein CcoG [Betaproteobacteria bacterium]NDB43487.1 cytochrome c oxidase accessory protein CcoG [Betaproteobacteria bacterium]NDD00589.1 cytochrome c oxidase accessory protein CcoG [Betaproteobacteria bacterium]NDD22487.1 cytochrome c oxidase accessory protein CcoG [Betaproteobacteria bacterium]
MESSDQTTRKVIPIVPSQEGSGNASDEAAWGELYAAHQKIYPRSVQGIFAKWRWGFVFLTQIIFYCLPWLEWGQRQAVLFDLGVRRFYIFGIVLYPQDFIYLTGLLVISAFSLFLFTAIAGRLWCGYACPQTVYSEIFMWIERKVEGDRTARMRLDSQDMSLEKLVKKWYKHFLWIGLSIWTGFTFVGYFTPIRELGMEFFLGNMSSWEVFWVFFYGFATYGNAGFMREQVCKYMCPYARFQSAMFDKDTLIVTYDAERGEPRGARSKKADLASLSLGACVDCTLCVQVCPTGIDIRNGLQYECIGCGACADVCDTVMDKVGYPRGLVKYSTQHAMQNKWTASQTLKHIFRPRVLIYTGILLLVVGLLFGSLLTRKSFKVDVVRDRATLARIVSGGNIENVYRLQIMNAAEKRQHFKVTAEGLYELKVLTDSEDLTVESTQSRWVSVRLQVPYDSAVPGSYPVRFTIEASDDNETGHTQLEEKSVFLIPR